MSTFGNDVNACTAEAPCLSFDRAYRVALPGDLVWVAGGTYPAQRIPLDATKPQGPLPPVVFRTAPGAVVRTGAVRIEGTGVEFQEMTMAEWHAAAGSADVVFRNVVVDGGVFVSSAARISMFGGSVGPGVDFSPEIKATAGSSVPPTDVLFDGVTFHDWTRNDPAAHVDCLHVLAVDGLIVRNSRFRNCEAFAILFTLYGTAGSPRDVLIENNFFDCCRTGHYSISLGDTPGAIYKNFLIRFNSTNKNFIVARGATAPDSNIRFDSNIAPSVNPTVCDLPGVTLAYNVWGGGSPCDPTDKIAPPAFVNEALLDFHLLPTSRARRSGNPRLFPATDIDGEPRGPGPPDAGADQLPAPTQDAGPNPGQPGQPDQPGQPIQPQLALPALRLTGLRFRRTSVGIPVRCTHTEPPGCAGLLRLSAGKGRRWLNKTRTFTLEPGKGRTVWVRLRPRTVAALKARRRTWVSLKLRREGLPVEARTGYVKVKPKKRKRR